MKIAFDSRNLIYVATCPTKKSTLIRNSKLRDRFRIYRQHIWQPEHEKLKVEKHLRTCGKGNFTKAKETQLVAKET